MNSSTANPTTPSAIARRSSPLVRGAVVASVLLALNATASACAVCMGGDNEQLKDASNTVLWSLLAMVGFIFVATGCTAYYLWRKATAPVPPDTALIQTLPHDAQET